MIMIPSSLLLEKEEGAVCGSEAAISVATVASLPPPPPSLSLPPLSPPPTHRIVPRKVHVTASSDVDEESCNDNVGGESCFLGEGGHDAIVSSPAVRASSCNSTPDRSLHRDDKDSNSNLANTELLSRREQIRAKLRLSEQRLLSFTSRGCSGPNGDGGFAAVVTADLKRVEEEKDALAFQLQAFQQKTMMEDEFLREKLQGIQSGFQKQVETIQGLQHENSIKDDEIASLRNDLFQKLRRIVELEFDLETHAIHFTNYAKEQFQLGEDALREIKKQHSNNNNNSHGADPSQRKAQKLIAKLLTDLDALEARYKTDRLDAASELHRAQMTIEQLLIQVQVLEQQQQKQQQQQQQQQQKSEGGAARQQQNEGAGEKTKNDWLLDPSSRSSDDVQVLRRRNQTLEARRVLAQQEVDRLSSELKDADKRTQEMKLDHASQIQLLELDNACQKAQINQLLLHQSQLQQQQLQRHHDQMQQQQKQQQLLTRENSKKMGLFGTGKRKPQASAPSLSPPAGAVQLQPIVVVDEDAAREVAGNYYSALAALEIKVKTSCEAMALLEAERSIRNRQISFLKQEVVSLRIKELSHNTDSRDAQLLNSLTGRQQQYKIHRKNKTKKRAVVTSGEGTKEDDDDDSNNHDKDNNNTGDDADDDDDDDDNNDDSDETSHYIAGLQSELQHSKQLLVKMDQELVMERAKYASTVAGLLARITELSARLQHQHDQQQQQLLLLTPGGGGGGGSGNSTSRRLGTKSARGASPSSMSQNSQSASSSSLPLRFYL